MITSSDDMEPGNRSPAPRPGVAFYVLASTASRSSPLEGFLVECIQRPRRQSCSASGRPDSDKPCTSRLQFPRDKCRDRRTKIDRSELTDSLLLTVLSEGHQTVALEQCTTAPHAADFFRVTDRDCAGNFSGLAFRCLQLAQSPSQPANRVHLLATPPASLLSMHRELWRSRI
jgi:hypothetical protein